MDVVILNMTSAAQESCKMVGQLGFYPPRRLGLGYVERYTSVMEQRLAMAAARLSKLLNQILQ